jgi:Arrestin (or S-antigen), N-terminal domain
MSSLEMRLDRRTVRPGEAVSGTVILELKEPLRARGVRVRLRGEEYTHVPYGRSTVYDRRPILDHEIVLTGNARFASFEEGLVDAWNVLLNRLEYEAIPSGIHEYPFSFPLPADAPPSYDGNCAEVEYRLAASVDVPVWLDLRAQFDLRVAPPANSPGNSPAAIVRYPPPEGVPPIWEDLGSPFRPKIRATLELARSRYAAGEKISGQLSVEDAAGARLRGAEYTLVLLEEAAAEGHSVQSRSEAVHVHPPWLEAYAPDVVMPFELTIPEGVAPTLVRPHFTLQWFLRARLFAALGSHVTLVAPVVIV